MLAFPSFPPYSLSVPCPEMCMGAIGVALMRCSGIYPEGISVRFDIKYTRINYNFNLAGTIRHTVTYFSVQYEYTQIVKQKKEI